MNVLKKVSGVFGISLVLLLGVLFALSTVQVTFAQTASPSASGADEAPFMYSLAATWEGKGIVRYRVAVQPQAGAVLEGLKIIAHNPVKGNVSVVTEGAVV